MRIFSFELAGRNLALPAEVVAQVYEAAPATPLPFVPDYVDGLALVSGRILPQIDLSRRLGLGQGAGEELLVMRSTRGAVILRVDCVSFIDSVDDDLVAGMGEEDTLPQAADFFHGQFEVRGQSHFLLRPESLAIEGCVADPLAAPASGLLGEREEAASLKRAADVVCLVVHVGRDTFAFPLSAVTEVFRDGALTPVTGAPPLVAGISVSRRIPRLVLPLGRALGLDAPPGPAMVEVETRAGRLLFACDGFEGIRRFPVERYERTTQRALSGYLFGPDGRVTPMIDVDSLIDRGAAEALAPFVPRLAERAHGSAATGEAARKLLLFRAAGETCAIPSHSLVRVARHRAITPVPAGGDRVAGIVDIGGTIMPVVDLRTRLDGHPDSPADNGVMPAGSGVIIVAQHEQQKWALLVERVDRLAEIPLSAIRPAGEASPFVSAIGRLDDQLVTILNVAALSVPPPVADLSAAIAAP